MSYEPIHVRRRTVAVLLMIAVLVVVAVALAPAEGRGQSGARSAGATVQPALGLPARDVNPIGMPANAAAGETWAYAVQPAGAPASVDGQRVATDSTRFVLLRKDDGTQWQIRQGALDAAGQPLGYFGVVAGPGAGRVTRDGGVAVAGLGGPTQAAAAGTLLVKDPGGSQARALPPPVAPVLQAGEALARPSDVAFAAVDEGGHTGLYVAPQTGSGPVDGVLHWNGSTWSREPIELPAEISSVNAIRAISATSASNAWMVVSASGSPTPGVVLFRRVPGASPKWVRQALSGSAAATFSRRDPGTHVESVRALPYPAESLTATEDGVWIDGAMARSDVSGQPATFTLHVDAGSHQVHSWCAFTDLPQVCERPLNVELSALSPDPPGYRSFAWAGDGAGTRVITNTLRAGQPRAQSTSNGTYAVFADDEFTRHAGGGSPNVDGRPGGGAFASTNDGWLGGKDDLVRVTNAPAASRLQPHPVPFRDPLTAIAGEPGKAPGDAGAGAIAVGDRGEVARYQPGRGWEPEFLLNSNGSRATPRLRGVAWPEPSRAHAVGDLGEMWLWRAETGLWERDEAVPLEFDGNLTAVAFQPGSAERGYAVGRGGVLLRYGKNWEQEALPAAAQGDDLTSVAFAGDQALVAAGRQLLVNNGSGWQIDQGIANLLHDVTGDAGSVYAVAGLPDGGAVAAGFGFVAERESAGASWKLVDQPLNVGTVVAAAAFRDQGKLRAVVSLDRDRTRYPDTSSDPGQGDPSQPPPILQPFGLPRDGFVLRETANGWSDEQHDAFRLAQPGVDAALQPDPVFGLLIDERGHGWAVGGKTGALFSSSQFRAHTAGVYRYPAEGASPIGASQSAPQMQPGLARFAIGGDARCLAACADQALQGTRPDVGLESVLGQAAALRAASANGPRAFLYSGGRLSTGTLDSSEAQRYAEIATSSGSLPFYGAPAEHDRACGSQQIVTPFTQAFDSFPAPFGRGNQPGDVDLADVPLTAAAPGARTHYAFDSGGPGGTVRVIVIDNSCGSLAASDAAGQNPNESQRQWIALTLDDARARGIPAIVVGSRDLRAGAPANVATDATDTAQLLAAHGASAYFYDSPRENRRYLVPAGAAQAVPEFGSGTLGYGVQVVNQFEFFAESGFLLAEVNAEARDAQTNIAPVGVRLQTVLDDLALDATDGLLLRRSRVALFQALGRRPRAGDLDASAGAPEDPYVTLPPKPCVTAACASRVEPEYSFASSNPDIGDFVRRDPKSTNLRAVYLGADGKPVSDARSGLFCAFNAGKTTVTVQAGNLAFSQQVTIQPGSVRRPCGTRPLQNPPKATRAASNPGAPVSPPAAPSNPPTVNASIPQIPPATPSPSPPVAPFVAAVLVPPVVDVRVPPLVPPPPGAFVRPTPPSGFSSVRVEEQQRDDEPAFEDQNAASRYRADDGALPGAFLFGLVLVAALAGVSLRRPRGGRRAPAPVPAETGTRRNRR